MLPWVKSSLVVYFLNTCGGADVTYAVNFFAAAKGCEKQAVEPQRTNETRRANSSPGIAKRTI